MVSGLLLQQCFSNARILCEVVRSLDIYLSARLQEYFVKQFSHSSVMKSIGIITVNKENKYYFQKDQFDVFLSCYVHCNCSSM